jgi:hypothetical protein
VSLRFEDNGRFHDDLVVQCGHQRWVCDSYYLQLDRGMLPHREDAFKVRGVLRRLIEQWRDAVAAVPDGQVRYLPFDFSDEYTRWLRCAAAGPLLTIQPGSATVPGYSFFPSAIGNLLEHVPGFAEDGDAITVTRTRFLQSLDQENARG